MDEDVLPAVRVTGDEILDRTGERHVSPVEADVHIERSSVADLSVGVDRHQLRLSRSPIVYIDLGVEVGVGSNKIRGIAHEGDEPPVVAQGGIERGIVRLRTGA